jgi:hypothetical protein
MQAEIADDVERLVDTVHGLLQTTGDGERPETVRVALELPKAWIVVAAWLDAKGERHRAGDYTASGFASPDEAPDVIDAKTLERAMAFLERTLDYEMHRELQGLATRAHALWRTRPPGYRRAGDPNDPAIRQARALVEQPAAFGDAADRYHEAVGRGDQDQAGYWRRVFAEIVLIFDEEFRACGNEREADMLERCAHYSAGGHDPSPQERVALEASGARDEKRATDGPDFADTIPF